MTTTLPITCPSVHATPRDPDKRLWLIATGVAGGAAALATAVPFVSTFAPSERAKAAGVRWKWTSPTSRRAARRRWNGAASPCGWCGAPRRCCSPAGPRQRTRRSAVGTGPAARLHEEPGTGHQARGLRRHWHLHPPGMLAQQRAQGRQQPQSAGRLARRVFLSLPWLHLRRRRPRVQEQAGPDQPGDPAAPLCWRRPDPHRRRRRSLKGLCHVVLRLDARRRFAVLLAIMNAMWGENEAGRADAAERSAAWKR